MARSISADSASCCARAATASWRALGDRVEQLLALARDGLRDLDHARVLLEVLLAQRALAVAQLAERGARRGHGRDLADRLDVHQRVEALVGVGDGVGGLDALLQPGAQRQGAVELGAARVEGAQARGRGVVLAPAGDDRLVVAEGVLGAAHLVEALGGVGDLAGQRLHVLARALRLLLVARRLEGVDERAQAVLGDGAALVAQPQLDGRAVVRRGGAQAQAQPLDGVVAVAVPGIAGQGRRGEGGAQRRRGQQQVALGAEQGLVGVGLVLDVEDRGLRSGLELQHRVRLVERHLGEADVDHGAGRGQGHQQRGPAVPPAHPEHVADGDRGGAGARGRVRIGRGHGVGEWRGEGAGGTRKTGDQEDAG